MTNRNESQSILLLRAASVMVTLLVMTFVAIYYNETETLQNISARSYSTILLLLAFNLSYAFSFLFVYQRDQKRTNVALFGLVLCTVGLYFTSLSLQTAGSFTFFCLARVPESFRLRVGLYFVAGTTSLFLFASFFRGLSFEDLRFLVFSFPFYFFVLAISYSFTNERKLKTEAFALLNELRSTQALLTQSSQQNERLRIARDLHDTLGHNLTAQILNLEVARHKSSGESQDCIEQSIILSKVLLNDLRTAVSDLRVGTSFDFQEALTTLITNVPQLKVELNIEPGLIVDEGQLAETLLRCIQESITNTLRHSKATRCTINLNINSAHLMLRFEDNGVCNRSIEQGNGLTGIQERVDLMSGKMSWDTENGSFSLVVELPLGSK